MNRDWGTLTPIDTRRPLPYTGALDPYFVQRTLSRQPCQHDDGEGDAVCPE
jgi:hypothetical protein